MAAMRDGVEEEGMTAEKGRRYEGRREREGMGGEGYQGSVMRY